MSKNFLPISIDISNSKILIIGGRLDAFKKLKILQRFNAQVEVLAENVCDEIKESGVRYFQKSYEKSDLSGYLMVYSCTNNDGLNDLIIADAGELGVLVNIHDEPEKCQFVSPAIYKRGNITVAVASNGKDVYSSIRIRDILKQYLETTYFIKN